MHPLLTLVITMTLFTSCSTGSAERQLPQYDYSQAKIIRDLPYGSDSLQRMDLYLPAGRSPQQTKTMILIHGGGWNSGTRNEFTAYIDSFRRRMPDWAIVNLDYRLVGNGRAWPAPEEDVHQAVNLVADSSVAFGIRRNGLVLLGVSAGGHLALLQAYKHADPQVAAVVDFFGPTDLTAMYLQPWHPFVPIALQMVTGTNPALQPGKFREWSPVIYVGAKTPPTLLLHGAADPVVDLSQSKSLKKKLDEAGVTNDLVVYPGQRHGWQGKDLTHSFDRIEAFLRQTVK